MRVLLDTHLFLWLVAGDSRLNKTARAAIREASEVFISSATVWEIAIKVRLGKLRADPAELLEEIGKCGFQELPVEGKHALPLAKLPMHHGDPFDRLLIAQAMSEQLRFLTADSNLSVYSDLVECVAGGR
jgi:PIN domain nuclease of toxin-antitoxin system